MRVWINAQGVDIDGQDICVADHVIALSRWNVDRPATELDHERRMRRWIGCKKESDAHLHGLCFALGKHVQLQDEIAPRLDRPGHVGRLRRGHPAWRPPDDVPARTRDAVGQHPIVARFGIRGIEPPRHIGTIERQDGMVNVGSAGMELYAANGVSRRQWDGNDEVSEYIAPAGPQQVRRGHFDNEIRYAQLPPLGPRRPRRQA